MRDRRKLIVIISIMVFIFATFYFSKINTAFGVTDVLLDEKEVGIICLKQSVPGFTITNENEKQSEKEPVKKETDSEDSTEQIETITSAPLVIIYHTHSSESYLPYSESNYHREEEEGTVRDVGNVLEVELKKQGINVIHDKTVHDRPSYNESYSRSLSTVQKLINENPQAQYVIDLHRDAASSSVSEGKWLEINGEKVAKYSLVVGKANENYVELYDFAEKIKNKSNSMYQGFGGNIIEKNYNYNEFLSNKSILLEVGNNKNTIEEARKCAYYFADVLAEIIKEE